MSRKEDVFIPALTGKKIPILTLDNKWHQLFTQTEPNKGIRRLEEELNQLLKKQGKANTESKKIRQLKKRLMQEIVDSAEAAAQYNEERALRKQEENKRLILECNEKLEEYKKLQAELPDKIEKVNHELMLLTMEICYETLKKNEKEIEETAQWIAGIRTELKDKLVQKQEKEIRNQELYAYMHDIFGAEVIELFDMKYSQEE